MLLAVGVAGSVGLLLHSAGRGVSPILVFVMVAWVLAPFAALALTRRWLSDAVIVVVTAASLAIYAADAVSRLHAKAAFVYVIVPLAAWGIIAVALLIGWMRRVRVRPH